MTKITGSPCEERYVLVNLLCVYMVVKETCKQLTVLFYTDLMTVIIYENTRNCHEYFVICCHCCRNKTISSKSEFSVEMIHKLSTSFCRVFDVNGQISSNVKQQNGHNKSMQNHASRREKNARSAAVLLELSHKQLMNKH